MCWLGLLNPSFTSFFHVYIDAKLPQKWENCQVFGLKTPASCHAITAKLEIIVSKPAFRKVAGSILA